MRIISGKARGTKLTTLEGTNTRPTLDRVKESLFNIIQNQIPESTFLDLFSGSGAIGLEALSRGAKKAILCDNSKKAIEIIKKNIQKTHFEKQTKIYNKEYDFVLNNEIKEKLDIIYLDPPYKTELAYKAIQLLIKNNLLKEEAIIIVETDEEQIINKINELDIDMIDKRKYGRANLIFFKKK